MKQTKYYRYLGTNGYIETPVELPGVYHTTFYQLDADKDKMLSDGAKIVKSVTVSENEIDNWTEIDK